MSSTESSGAPAEATATSSAPDAAFPTFGTTRGSGLARGKRPSTGPAAATTAAPSDYKPTAIEVVNAPREYVNPFAPEKSEPVERVEEPAAATPEPAAPAAAAPVAPVITQPAPVAATPDEEVPAAEETPAELNILPPAEHKTSTAQTWESEGFRPAREVREARSERPRREERTETRSETPADEPVDIDSIPPQFLYVRPGVTFVPTPRNWGGAPRERRPSEAGTPRTPRAPRTTEAAPAKSGGFFGWLKSLFTSDEAPAAPVTTGASADEPRRDGGQRRHRGGRNRTGQGGERRSRGGRSRSGGSRQGGI